MKKISLIIKKSEKTNIDLSSQVLNNLNKYIETRLGKKLEKNILVTDCDIELLVNNIPFTKHDLI